MSTILYTETFDEIDELTRSKFKHCDIFLDANFVLSLLGIDDEETNEAARELFELVKKCGFKVRVFDFTIDEIAGLLGHYLEEEYRYPTTVNINSISSKLKQKGWSRADVTLLIANMDIKLNNIGIDVRTGTGVDLQKYNPSDDTIRSKMAQFKPEQMQLSQNHDLAAIEQIQLYRAKTFRKLEHCKAILLTSDTRLNRFNFIGMGHRAKRTMSEVILDRLLSVILWLKNPTARIPLKSVIAAYSKETFVDKPVWDRFYDVLKDLRQTKKISDEDISTLFYSNYIEDALSDLSDREIQKITPEFVIEQIEKASKIIEKEKEEITRKHEEKIKDKETEFLNQLHESQSKIVYEKDREWLEKVKQSKQSINHHVSNLVKKRIRNIKISIVIIFALPLIICVFIQDWLALQNVWKIISIVFLVLGVVQFFIPRLWEILQEKWTGVLYLRRVKEANLDDVSFSNKSI